MATVNVAVLAVKVIALLFVVIAAACVAAGRRFCVKVGASEGCNNAIQPYKIDNWHNLEGEDKPVKGQYFVFVSSLVLVLATIAALVMRVMGAYDFPARVVSIMGIVLCIINGSLEVWYANGWNSAHHGDFYIQSWAAAAAFYFAALIMYVIDFTFPRK